MLYFSASSAVIPLCSKSSFRGLVLLPEMVSIASSRCLSSICRFDVRQPLPFDLAILDMPQFGRMILFLSAV